MKILKVEWLLTRKCNIRCEYCQIAKGKTIGEELTLAQVVFGVDYINRRFPGVMIVFFGGEPTTIDWLPELVKHCESIGQLYAIISNGIRVLKDEEYFTALVKAGLSNWSVSIDTLEAVKKAEEYNGVLPGEGSRLKSHTGMWSLMKMKDAGVKDLVSCIAVTKNNIKDLPEIVKRLTKLGVWSITSPLQIGDGTFEYSSSDKSMEELKCKDMKLVNKVANELEEMAVSGKYLMHNGPEYYRLWNEHFSGNNWKCDQGKFALTIDADGSLKRCVEQKAGLEKFNILSLDIYEYEYEQELRKDFKCRGCFWDPAVETTIRAKNWNFEDARKSYLHNRT